MKAHNILSLIFTAFILAYPLYDKLLIKDTYRSTSLYYGYVPLALICLLLMLWTIISSNIESSRFHRKLTSQESRTESLLGESLKISSIEIRTTYRFKYQSELNATFNMQKANPIKSYLVNSEVEKDSLSFTCDNPNVYFPDRNTVEFKFTFIPEDPTDIHGKQLGYLEKYDKVYFPWKSFTHFLALLKLGSSMKTSTEPILIFQILINGRVLIDQIVVIKNIDPSSTVLIFTAPELFKDIEIRSLDL